MRRLTLAAAISAALSSAAWGQAPPSGTYQFISGPGVGTPAFTVAGFSTSLGGSIGGIHIPNCAGIHVHGVFNGFADPSSGGCGHGIIQMLVAPPPVSGGSLPGGVPTSVAGQLALTAPSPGVRVDFDLLRSAQMSGFALPSGGIAMALDMLQGRAGDGQTVNFVGGEVGGTVMDLERPAAGNVLQTSLANPAQRVLSSPAATSWLEEFAVLDDRDAEGHRREADRTRQQADEWRKLSDDARRDAERNRQRADDARKDGRDADAKGWDEEAGRDRAESERRDREAQRLDVWSEEQRQREEAARQQAQERRDAAERAREAVRQAERERTQRARQEAEERARQKQAERDARLRQEQAERDKRIQDLQDRVRAREAEAARQRERAEREYRQWLAEQEAQKNARARGSSSDADLAAAAARAAAEKKKKEEEEKTWADYVVGLFEGKSETPEEKLLQAIKEKLEDKLKDEAMKRSGLDKFKEELSEAITNKLDDLGLDAAAGKLGEGVESLKKIKEIGDWMNSELDKMPGRQQRQMNKVDAILDPRNERVLRGAGSGTIAGRDVIDVFKGAVEILK